jgi:hypothetical protein
VSLAAAVTILVALLANNGERVPVGRQAPPPLKLVPVPLCASEPPPTPIQPVDLPRVIPSPSPDIIPVPLTPHEPQPEAG